ncbi:putative glycosyl hydrolase family 15 [Rosellinia necatrix]|uniref:Glucoamylase n=1 Tax=Rosellinia necatrix TaxID=77044 RepID=A0A1W2TGZ2_ROSNE|nr:putative glycosyl hydrolase family 15 [Rosellinia necatrix]
MGIISTKTIVQLSVLVACGVANANARCVPQANDLDGFVEKQRAISLQGVLNNIGPDGSRVPGAGAGVIVASPSTENPNYFYTWSRDAALTMKMIVDEFLLGEEQLESYIEDYIHSQAILQTVTNPSGTFLPNGAGLGEPKYNVDLTRFNGAWGRPQRDGPALRAIALITYSNWLVSSGQAEKAQKVVWPVISNDLSYVGQYWNSTGFDLWEEVQGSSFFTTQNQFRALVEGDALATTLGVRCTGCDQAPQVACFLGESYWNGEYFVANINNPSQGGRTGKDANTVLGSIAVFDVGAACDDPSIQPCHSRALSNFKAVVDAFRDPAVYPINDGVPRTEGIAVGRYTEDVYFTGNPWYLITAAAAEYLYDAVAQWTAQGTLTIDATSLGFFRDLYPAAQAGTHGGGSAAFADILAAATAYAESFVAVVERHAPADGSLAEQFGKAAPFAPTSAAHLTWSYAAFVSMAERRAGQYPARWVGASPTTPSPPPQCVAGSTTKGAYAPATAAGAPDVNVTCTVNVRFEVNATTYYGENVLVAGNTTDLGAWDAAAAWPLDASGYSDRRPLWAATVALAAGEGLAYAYLRQEDCGQDPIPEPAAARRTLAVPACDPDADPDAVLVVTDDAWQGPVGSSGGC